jgi:hypothetical protein
MADFTKFLTTAPVARTRGMGEQAGERNRKALGSLN